MAYPGGLGGSRERHAAGAGASSSGRDQVQIRIDKFDLDNEVDDLRSHVGRIKQMALAIEDERKQQSDVINSLEESMENARMVLKRTMGRLNVAYKQAQSNHMLVLVFFAIVLFTAIYVVAKIYKLGRHVIGS